MKKLVLLIPAVLFVALFAGCGNQCEEFSPEDKAAMVAYNKLPLSTQRALRSRDLEKVSYFIVLEKGAAGHASEAISDITSAVLNRGGERAKNQAEADLVFTLKTPTSPAILESPSCDVELRDKNGLVLLQYPNNEHLTMREILIKTLISLATERRNRQIQGEAAAAGPKAK